MAQTLVAAALVLWALWSVAARTTRAWRGGRKQTSCPLCARCGSDSPSGSLETMLEQPRSPVDRRR